MINSCDCKEAMSVFGKLKLVFVFLFKMSDGKCRTSFHRYLIQGIEIHDYDEQLTEIISEIKKILEKDIPKLNGKAKLEVMPLISLAKPNHRCF